MFKSSHVLKCFCQSSDVRKSSWRSLWAENEANVHFAYFIPPGKRIWWSKWGKEGEDFYYNLTIQILSDWNFDKIALLQKCLGNTTNLKYAKVFLILSSQQIWIYPTTVPQIEWQDNIHILDSHCSLKFEITTRYQEGAALISGLSVSWEQEHLPQKVWMMD